MLKRIIFLLVLLFRIGEVQAGTGAPFYYGLMVDGVPYIFIDNKAQVTRVKESLLKGMLENKPILYQQHLSTSPDSTLTLFSYEVERGGQMADYKLWKLSGRKWLKHSLSGFPDRPQYWMQILDSSSVKTTFELKIEDFFYDINGSVVARCAPVKARFSSRGRPHGKHIINFVASPYRYRYAPMHIVFDNVPLPKLHQSILKNLPNTEISDSVKAGNFYVGPKLSTQCFLYKNQLSSKLDTLYALMCSYNIGNKARAGTLLILDKNGVEFHRSKKNGYYYIQGITDVDGSGAHELILRNGAEWREFRYELLVPEYDQKKKLEFKSKFNKRPPSFLPMDC